MPIFGIASPNAARVESKRFPSNFKDAPNMTRTPMISVTAIAIAARAFAWDITCDAPRDSWASFRQLSRTPSVLPLLP
jgi:hypothetical protein